jgi:GNAT superfamily N-acetyltransferase
VKIEPLSRLHDRDHFDCGTDALNLYLKQTARQHADRGISQTFVLVENDSLPPKTIFGFFTLSVCEVESNSLPVEFQKKYPRKAPAVRLARLAVASQSQGRGFGKDLMIFAMKKFWELFKLGGGIGLFVDAKDTRAKQFYEKFGFIPFHGNELQLFLPLNSIQEALEASG